MARRPTASLSFSAEELSLLKLLFTTNRRRQLVGAEVLRTKVSLQVEAKAVRAAERLVKLALPGAPGPVPRRKGVAPRARSGGRNYVPHRRCDPCAGVGVVYLQVLGGAQPVSRPCGKCHGRGKVPAPTSP